MLVSCASEVVLLEWKAADVLDLQLLLIKTETPDQYLPLLRGDNESFTNFEVRPFVYQMSLLSVQLFVAIPSVR